MSDWLFLHEQQLAEIDGKISEVREEVVEAATTADHAVETAGNALMKAGSAQATAQDAKQRAQNAEELARTAGAKADNANTKANNAIQTATSASETAAAADQKATRAEGKADTAVSKASTAESKADTAQSEVDALETLVDNLDQLVGQLRDLLDLKQDIMSAGNGIDIVDNEIVNTKPNVWGVDPDNGGVYFPDTIEPELVNKNNILVSEATKLNVVSNRILALFGGLNINLKTATPAGGTRFEVSNTFANRFTCASARNGYATIEQATAGELIVKITDIYLANDPDKTPLTPYSGPNESKNNIIIETDAPLSETEPVKKMRVYGTMTFDTSLQCVMGGGTGGVTGKGKLLQLGQAMLALDGNSIMVGNSIFSSAARSALFGFQIINKQMAALLAGQGHDSSNGKAGVAAVGSWSDIKPTTALAVGNGTSNTARGNIFEVADNNGETEIHAKSANGTEFKMTINDTGSLHITPV